MKKTIWGICLEATFSPEAKITMDVPDLGYFRTKAMAKYYLRQNGFMGERGFKYKPVKYKIERIDNKKPSKPQRRLSGN